jgi:uncharacterized SAM-binding protein YcdF (DUF218 family)
MRPFLFRDMPYLKILTGLIVMILLGFLLFWIWIFSPESSYVRALRLQTFLALGKEIPIDYGDVILVPGSGCNPGCGTEERLALAAMLYQNKPRKILISEGNCLKGELYHFILMLTKIYNVNPQDIVVDSTSTTTFENVSVGVEIALDSGWREMVVCTSPFHQLRVGILMAKSKIPDYKLAHMPDSLLQLDKDEVYRQKRWQQVKDEIKKSAYSLFL